MKQKKYLVDEAEYSKKKIELEVLQQTTVIYAKLLLNKEQSIIERNNIIKTDKELEIVSEKIKLGKISKYEFHILNARKNTEEADLLTVQNDSSIALQQLKQLLNISYKEEIDIASIDTTYITSILFINISSMDFIDKILKIDPFIQQAKMDELVARMSQKIAKNSLLPSLSIGGNLASNYNSNQRNRNGEKLSFHNQLRIC